MSDRSLFGGSLLMAAAGAFANIVTVTRVAQPHERTAGTYFVAVIAFLVFVIVARAVRGHRAASRAALGGVTLAAALGFFWWTNPFGGWTGISLLILIPIQLICCVFGLLGKVLWRNTPVG